MERSYRKSYRKWKIFINQSEQEQGRKLCWAFTDWLRQGDFESKEQREAWEPSQVMCAEQAGADWLIEAFLFWESPV